MTKRPHRFEINIDPAFSSATKYKFENGSNLYISSEHAKHRQVIPTLHQWAGFWRLCNFLDLWNWLPDYQHFNARDGESWEIDIALDKSTHIHCTGTNFYPSLENAKTGSPTIDRFGLLLHFIDIALLQSRVDFRDDYRLSSRL